MWVCVCEVNGCGPGKGHLLWISACLFPTPAGYPPMPDVLVWLLITSHYWLSEKQRATNCKILVWMPQWLASAQKTCCLVLYLSFRNKGVHLHKLKLKVLTTHCLQKFFETNIHDQSCRVFTCPQLRRSYTSTFSSYVARVQTTGLQLICE